MSGWVALGPRPKSKNSSLPESENVRLSPARLRQAAMACAPMKTWSASPIQPLVAPEELNPAVPGDFSEAILKALAKSPKDRFRSCFQFSDALDAALGRGARTIRPTDVRWDPHASADLRSSPGTSRADCGL